MSGVNVLTQRTVYCLKYTAAGEKLVESDIATVIKRHLDRHLNREGTEDTILLQANGICMDG